MRQKVAEKVFSELAKGTEEESVKAKHQLAFGLKKNKEWQKAVDVWTGSGSTRRYFDATRSLC